MSISISTPLPQSAAPVKSRTAAGSATLPVYLYAVSVASLFTVVGILWDISWHKSIGRDKFLSPPHILVYLGAIFAGLFSGVRVLRDSFRPTAATRASHIKVWGVFYSSLGSLFCIWGAIAMLTSAPFDDWWHSAYGLDVTILSPPHTLLAMGMIFLQFGACVSISNYLNYYSAEGPGANASTEQPGAGSGTHNYSILRLLFIICSASLLCMVYGLGTDYLHARGMRNSFFYIVAAATSLLFLPAFGRALRMRWGMTAIATGYFLIVAISNWILQLFPAEPKLGPILTHTTHFQPSQFPLLIMIPALAMDLIMGFPTDPLKREGRLGDWQKALLLSIFFIGILLAVEYPFSGFLLQSPGARNWFFGAETWYFGMPPDAPYRYKFRPNDIAPLLVMAEGLGIALLIGVIAARISLRWGKWLQSVQR
jgi:hypothetical protein